MDGGVMGHEHGVYFSLADITYIQYQHIMSILARVGSRWGIGLHFLVLSHLAYLSLLLLFFSGLFLCNLIDFGTFVIIRNDVVSSTHHSWGMMVGSWSRAQYLAHGVTVCRIFV